MKQNIFLITLAAIALASCGGNNANQQPAATAQQPVPSQAVAPAQAPVAPSQAAPAAQPAQLPTVATDFIQQTFKGKNVVSAIPDYDDGVMHFDVHLSDGTELEFAADGQWKKVDCHKMAPVPAALVPQNIASYVKANYGGAPITKIDKSPYGYEIELANDLDLKFTPQGQLMVVDD